MKAGSYADVVTLLSRYGIPFSEWGNHEGTKTLQDLANEVISGESELLEDGNALFRKTNVASIVLFHCDALGILWALKEDRQVFHLGGKERRRGLPMTVAEKLKPGETAQVAALRGMREELRLNGLLSLHHVIDEVEMKLTPSWPGLVTAYVFHRFQGFIRPEDFAPHGYVHEQPDKTSYFSWHKVATLAI